MDTVRAYSRKGAADAVRHLHAVGRRRIAFVNGPTHTAPGLLGGSATWTGSARAGSARRPPDRGRGRLHGRAGPRATESLLERARPDAILCANDLLAVGASALSDTGLDVPADVALVGMDNSDLSALTWPALTTVDLGSFERARIAAELLLSRIDEPGRAPQVVGVEPRLVVRASSGAPA